MKRPPFTTIWRYSACRAKPRADAAKARNLPGRLGAVTCNFTARPYHWGSVLQRQAPTGVCAACTLSLELI
jgi:hypothetical protein